MIIQTRQPKKQIGFGFIILIFLSSCAIVQNSRIEKFESFVGKEISTCLDLSVELMDSLLVKYYDDSSSDIDSLYSYLTNGLLSDSIDWNRFYIHESFIIKYQQTAQEKGLTNELFLQYSDSKISNGRISVIYEYRPKDSTVALSTMNREWKLSHNEINNVDSLLDKIQKELQPNMYNKYYNGLEQFSKNNEMINEYLKKRKQFHGKANPSLVLSGFADMELDYGDYFYKRILATEILLLSDRIKYAIQQ